MFILLFSLKSVQQSAEAKGFYLALQAIRTNLIIFWELDI